MSTWQIVSDAGNNFQWKFSGHALRSRPEELPNASAIHSRLPSMADLLLQGSSRLAENGHEAVEQSPTFRTGFGKSVVLKQSSIAKALTVLGDDADTISSGDIQSIGNVGGFANSLFCTGSGKSVNVSSAGLIRAKKLLGLENNNGVSNSGFQHPRKSFNANEQHGGQNFSHLGVTDDMMNTAKRNDAFSITRPSIISKASSEGRELSNDVNANLLQSDVHISTPKLPPIKFHTAGGRSLSVSSDALERAKSLLGEPDLGTFFTEEDGADTSLSFFTVNKFNDGSSTKPASFHSPFTYPRAAKSKHISKSFIPPLRSATNQNQPSFNSENILGVDLIRKFDAVDDKFRGLSNTIPSKQRPLNRGPCEPHTVEDNSFSNSFGSSRSSLPRSYGPLVDISNTISSSYTNHRHTNNERKRFGRGTSIAPFKRPRASKFTTPLNKNISYAPAGLSASSSQNYYGRRAVSTRYPFHAPRMYVKEYFEVPPSIKSRLENIKKQVRWIKQDTAEKYTFYDESGLNCIGAEALYSMLVQSGASVQYASKEWVTNHYKWIVWKLACYERLKSGTRFLTVSNVLEELKYRYEREVNHGHRSAIKKILEGDVPPSSMLILCISDICISYEQKTQNLALNGSESSRAVKLELTDGWYSIDALLDVPLLKQLVAGKLRVGQKLRIWAAGLCGWVGPVSPLEVSTLGTVSLLLHINGTYRAHWADRLGFCKGAGPPLAFKCIKSNGGPVPRTLIGVTRVYPVLYKEKLSDGGSIVRSERMEAKSVQLYNQRRSAVVEGVLSEFQREMKGSNNYNDGDCEEGARILKILETAAEPEIIMAEMSPEQLTSFASYKAKLEATKQLDMEKAIKKALQDAALEEREVTPFMRVRVVGLNNYQGKGIPKEGLVTIWNPTEKQVNPWQTELVEGQAYSVAGLLPVNSDSNTLYLQARGSTMKWQPLTPSEIQHFQPFFSPRVSVFLSNLREVPLSSEFDTVAYVVHVGEVYTTAQWKKQWVFVTDSSISTLKSENMSNSLLAISFCSLYADEDAFAPINYNLAGSTVCFLNIIKKAEDKMNHLWIAEATENSVYALSFDSSNCSHLKNAAASTQSWAKTSSMMINKLQEKVLDIVGDIKASS